MYSNGSSCKKRNIGITSKNFCWIMSLFNYVMYVLIVAWLNLFFVIYWLKNFPWCLTELALDLFWALFGELRQLSKRKLDLLWNNCCWTISWLDVMQYACCSYLSICFLRISFLMLYWNCESKFLIWDNYVSYFLSINYKTYWNSTKLTLELVWNIFCKFKLF